MPSPFSLRISSQITAAVGLTFASLAGCSEPKTDDLDRLDTGVSMPDAAMDTGVSMMDAAPDVSAQPDVFDAAARDVNQCEVGVGSRFDLCNGVCIEIASDRNNCGMCGRRCAPDNVCRDGSCEFACSAGLVNCDNRCIDPRTNPDYCGAANDCFGDANDGERCLGGRSCVAGRCQFVCPAGQVACDGSCIDPNANPMFCRASGDCTGANRGTVCPAGQVCTATGCGCPAGFVSCGGTCIDPNTNRDSCGARMDCMGANAGTRCAVGEICVGGTCGTTCGTGAVLCGGNCIDPLSNRAFCGARMDCAGANAGRTCSSTELCINGTCQYFEPPQSYASLRIAEPFEGTVDALRPIEVTIGAIRNGAIHFTCNGAVPVPGTAGTNSASNVVFIPVGTTGCQTLRWYEDYGAPLGAERVIHTRRVNVVPVTPTTGGGNYIDAVRINGRGPVAQLTPGQSFTLDYNHQYWSSSPAGYCPGCILQSNISIDSDNAAGFSSLECASYGYGTFFPGNRFSRRRTLTAPMRPGRYAIRTRISLEFGCAAGGAAYPGGEPVGYIFVN